MIYDNAKNFEIGPHQKVKKFGDKYFFAFKENNDEYIFKQIHSEEALLSELFHSTIGQKLGFPCAQNVPATLLETLIDGRQNTQFGIASKNFLSDEESFTPARSVLHSKNVDYLTPRHTPYRLFQTVNLATLPKPKEGIDKTQFESGLMQNFLMAHVSDNADMDHFHNLGIIMPTHTVAPSFDFEFSKEFVNPKKGLREINERINVLRHGLNPHNASHLKENFPELTEEFLDTMQTLRNSPEFDTICDFTPLAPICAERREEHPENTQRRLSHFSEHIRNSYVTKFDKLADSFARCRQ